MESGIEQQKERDRAAKMKGVWWGGGGGGHKTSEKKREKRYLPCQSPSSSLARASDLHDKDRKCKVFTHGRSVDFINYYYHFFFLFFSPSHSYSFMFNEATFSFVVEKPQEQL